MGTSLFTDHTTDISSFTLLAECITKITQKKKANVGPRYQLHEMSHNVHTLRNFHCFCTYQSRREYQICMERKKKKGSVGQMRTTGEDPAACTHTNTRSPTHLSIFELSPTASCCYPLAPSSLQTKSAQHCSREPAQAPPQRRSTWGQHESWTN